MSEMFVYVSLLLFGIVFRDGRLEKYGHGLRETSTVEDPLFNNSQKGDESVVPCPTKFIIIRFIRPRYRHRRSPRVKYRAVTFLFPFRNSSSNYHLRVAGPPRKSRMDVPIHRKSVVRRRTIGVSVHPPRPSTFRGVLWLTARP